MKFGVLVFPGSNCDHDAYHVIEAIAKQPVTSLWHESHELENCDAIIVPGGFAYGDYLRTGAIAKFAPVMQEVKRFAESGGLVLGSCNGFQILCEAGLLPGALLRNASLEYRCEWVHVRVERDATPWTRGLAGDVLRMPIGHGEGCWVADPDTVSEVEQGGQVVFRYTDVRGASTLEANPNGSIANIAGVCNAAGN